MSTGIVFLLCDCHRRGFGGAEVSTEVSTGGMFLLCDCYR